MRQDDHLYYMRRAQQERDRAGTCEDNAAAIAHFKLAEEYERRVQDSAPIALRAAE
jgi:hypothetical protein